MLILALILLALVLPSDAGAQPPTASLKYRAELTRASQAVWGLRAPVPMFAGQIHQESAWRPEVCSPYACGLTQFTPDTAEWIAQAYGVELGSADAKQARFNPKWAIRAMVRYDKHLWDRHEDAATECDRAAFMLSGYNGGNGWTNRDKRLTLSRGGDPTRWWGHVELHSNRAGWAIRENRDYPRRILYQHQPRYATWGRVVCSG